MAAVFVPELVSVCGFYVIVLLFGIVTGSWARRRARGQEAEEMMLGGRRLGLWVGAMTITATSVGGGWINGTAEGVVSLGLLNVQAVLCYPLGIILVGPTFARTMRERGYTTMLDGIQERYGRRMGALLFIPPLCGDVCWAAAILAALGATLRVLAGVEEVTSVVVSTAAVVLYTVVGGFTSVAYTDVLQLTFMGLGLWLAVPFALTHEAVTPLSVTWPEWRGAVPLHLLPAYVDTALMLLGASFTFQAFYQRALAFASVKDLVTASAVATVAQFSFTIPPILLGAAAASADWRSIGVAFDADKDASIVLPLVLGSLCPLPVTCIGLGAITGAVMSSADSCFLSSATMFAHNVYHVLIRPRASEREVVWVVRISVACIGVAAAALALLAPSIYGLLVLSSDVAYVILFPQLLAALYIPGANIYGSVISFAASVILRVGGGEALLGISPFIHYPFFSETEGQLFPYKAFSVGVSLISLLTVSALSNFIFCSRGLDRKYDVFNAFPISKDKTEICLSEGGDSSSENVICLSDLS